jgi:hypothetical protein
MLAVTSWASLHCALFSIPGAVAGHPWFIATLFDAYWGFVCFYLWILWKEKGALSKVLWFLAVMLLGNIAMASFALRELFRIRHASEIPSLLATRNESSLPLPGLLCALSAVALILGSLS